MSYWCGVYHLIDTYVDRETDTEQQVVLEDSINSTSNHVPVWTAALGGIPLHMFDGVPCIIAGPLLRDASLRIMTIPWAYELLVRGNGEWGSVIDAARYLIELAVLCDRHHDDGKLWVHH